MPTEHITCIDCGEEFEHPEGEQKFFESKGWPAPIRCRTCRAEKKREKEERARQKDKDK